MMTIHAQTVGNVAGRDVVINSSGEMRPMTTTVLFVASNPRSTSAVRVLEELREVEETLQLAGVGDDVQIEVVPSARPADVQAALLRYRPQIVHVAGHGVADEIVLENSAGDPELVGAEWLTTMLRGTAVMCVLLNVCQSARLANRIAVSVHAHAVGWDGNVQDRQAVEFARAFYTGIGYGLSYAKAFDNARAFAFVLGSASPELVAP